MRLSTRYPYTAYPPGAVRLVEAQDERVGVLGPLDGVQDEPAVDARERAGGDGAEADRRVQRDRLLDDAAVLPAAGVGEEGVA